MKANRISKPNIYNIPVPQEAYKQQERTESTREINKQQEDNSKKSSILEQVYHESNMPDMKLPLLIQEVKVEPMAPWTTP